MRRSESAAMFGFRCFFTLGEFVQLLNAADDRITSRCSVGRVCHSEEEEEQFEHETTKIQP